jgi:uncharacterized integral membrane protein
VNDLPSKKTLESTGENYGFRLNARQLVGGLVAIVLVIFVLSNRQPVTVEFLFIEWNTSQWVVLTLTAIAGAIAGAGVFARRQRRKARRAAR